eukprot:3934792-Rhodomonas_salina.6
MPLACLVSSSLAAAAAALSPGLSTLSLQPCPNSVAATSSACTATDCAAPAGSALAATGCEWTALGPL